MPLLVLIVSLAFLAGCGGDDSETTESVATGADECASVDAPEARDPEPGEAPGRATRRVEDLHAHLRHVVRVVHGHARSGAGAEDSSVARRARERGLLRRHDLPPRRPGLRDPGRRPDAVRWRRPGVLDGGRSAVGRCGVHEGRRRNGEVAESRRRARPEAASSSSSRATPRRPDARLRDRRRGDGRDWTRSCGSTRSASATARRRSRSS